VLLLLLLLLVMVSVVGDCVAMEVMVLWRELLVSLGEVPLVVVVE